MLVHLIRIAALLVCLAVLLTGCSATSPIVPGHTPVALGESTPPTRVQVPTSTPFPTATATRTPRPTRTPAAGPPKARDDANVRAGPGTAFPKVGSVQKGELLQLVAANPNHDWLQLMHGPWISADLVENIPDLPVVQVPTAPPPTTVPEASPSSTPTP